MGRFPGNNERYGDISNDSTRSDFHRASTPLDTPNNLLLFGTACIYDTHREVVSNLATKQCLLFIQSSLGNSGAKVSDIAKRTVLAAALIAAMTIEGHSATNSAAPVLWNRLGSTNEVMQSDVGPGGTWNAGLFVPGRFGNAIELNMQQQFGCAFPINALTTTVGCLELWAKLSDFPDSMPLAGATPGFIGVGAPGTIDAFLMFFSANDGVGNGGLCARGEYGTVGTGSFGSWTYANAISGGAITNWHHYAMTWNGAGISSVAGGTRKIATFVDGILNSSSGSFTNGTGLVDPSLITRFGLLAQQNLVTGRVTFDNLKIWNYDKTDFSDRFDEGIIPVPNVVAWGNNAYGQISVPGDMTNAVGLGGGDHHATALRADGTVAAWGGNDFGQTNVPAGLAQVVSAKASSHNNIALCANGTLAVWGQESQVLLAVPAGLSNVVAVCPGVRHDLVLLKNGTVAAWGTNTSGQCTVPAGLSNVVAVSAGYDFSVALRADGTIASWGKSDLGQCTVPTGLSNVVAIAAGSNHSVALKADGTVDAWGYSALGQLAIPAGLSNVIAIAANGDHNLVLRNDGSVVGWGYVNGPSTVPAGLSNVVGVAAGQAYSMALLGVGKPVIAPVGSSLAVAAGSVFFLRTEAVGRWPLCYQWQKNGVDIEGADKLVLQSTGPQSGADEYQCVVSNTLGVSTGTVVRVSQLSDATYTLTVNATNGAVVKDPDQALYANGSLVTLTATADAGYHFTGWSGAVADTNNPVNLTVSNTTSVTASFVLNVVTVLTDRASISIAEGGTTNFQVKLSAQPTGVTVVVVGSTGDADISVSGGSNLTFSTTNWATYQTVTLAAIEDNGDAQNGTAIVTCSGSGITNAIVTATEIDDDHTLAVTAPNGTVTQLPNTLYYDKDSSVSLTAVQDAGYHFTGWSGDAAGTNNPVNVTITNTASVTANFALNEIAVLTDRAAVSVPEGGTTNFQVKLSAQPTGDTVVTVSRTAGDPDIAVSGGSSLTFSTVNWDSYQVATLSSAEDNDDNANGTAAITLSGAGVTNAVVTATEIDDDHTLSVTALNGTVTKDPDTAYYDNGSSAVLTAIQSAGYHFVDWSGDASGTNCPVSVTMDSNKSVTANFVLNVITVMTDRASVSVPEGSSTNFQVKLNVQPTGDTVVVVAWTSGDVDITPTAGTNLTFATDTWDVYQSVTLMAAEDNEDNSNGTTTITCSGADITNMVVTAIEIDDDYTLAVTAINGAVAKNPDSPLYDNGTSVSLEATQSAGYHFTGWSGAAEGVTNPVSLRITSNSSVTASFSLNIVTVLTDRASISVPEGYSTNFQVKLSAQPTGDTVIAVSRTSGDADVSVTTGGSLSFTVSNWANYQTVTVFAGEDNSDNVNGTATITCRGTELADATVDATEIDDDYTLTVISTNGSVVKNPDAALYDNGLEVMLTATEKAGYHFAIWSGDAGGTTNPVSLAMDSNKSVTANFIMNVVTLLMDRVSISVPEGGVTNFQVKLSAQPTGDTVVVAGRTSGDEDIAVSGTSNLTFSTSNWDTYQAVTLAAAEDNGDNQNGTASISCSGPGLDAAVVEAAEVDDDFTLTIASRYGTVDLVPDLPFYDNGTDVTLTAVPEGAYYVKGYSGDLIDTNNPASITMNGDKSVAVIFGPIAPQVLPPRTIGKKNFIARWKWAEEGAPEGELSVTLEVEGFPQFAPGYKRRYVVNNPECFVTNLLSGKTYWYRVRGLMSDGSVGAWSEQMKVQTGAGMPAFKNLLSAVPVSKGVSQDFMVSDLMTGDALLKVKSSDTNAVKAGLSAGVLSLQYLWKTNTEAAVTLTLTHPRTGYRVAYETTLRRAGGPVAIVANTVLTNAGSVVAQELTLENRTGQMVDGVRIRALGLDNADWLINKTGQDPVSKAAIREIPCVLPPGSQLVVRLVYNVAYKKQAKTRPAAFGAWAVMTPVSGPGLVNGAMSNVHQGLYDGLWLLGLPANRNRIYSVYHSDDEGATWVLDTSMIRATTGYLMWLDLDEGAPDNRVYRVLDIGI